MFLADTIVISLEPAVPTYHSKVKHPEMILNLPRIILCKLSYEVPLPNPFSALFNQINADDPLLLCFSVHLYCCLLVAIVTAFQLCPILCRMVVFPILHN